MVLALVVGGFFLEGDAFFVFLIPFALGELDAAFLEFYPLVSGEFEPPFLEAFLGEPEAEPFVDVFAFAAKLDLAFLICSWMPSCSFFIVCVAKL